MAGTASSSRGHGDSTAFSILVDLFDAVLKAKKGQMKRKHLSTFFNFLGRDFFSAMRLMIPELDKERGNYNLGADKLAKYTADALGLGKDTSDAKKLIEWKRGGARAGKSAGNFSMVAFEVLQNRQRETSGGLTIKELNDVLDKLVAAEKREGKTAVLTEILNRTNAREMKWIINIILKDLKMGISEKTIFSEFHPDAEDIFNVTCDLRAVCEKLKDRTKRFARQDIELGKAVRPQLAARVNTVEQAMKKSRGRQVVVECKFDGERIQCHVDGTSLNFFSRNFNDHAEIYRDAIGDDIIKQCNSSRCILDGEIVVWNNVLKSFAPFGQNKSAAKQDGDGVKGDETLCYIIFDILYYEDRSLIHLPLRERHEILKTSVRPLRHRIEVLVPDAELNREPGVQPWTIIPKTVEEAQAYFLEMVENRDEGVIIKDLESKWEPADRSFRWAKIKPDYINVETDLDVLIIGAMYGEGNRRGGKLANFLLGIAERPKAGGFPTKFHSFCRVGTGFSEVELDALRNRLMPYLRRNERGSKPPSFYICTGHHKERPDVWVDQPEKSVILQIKSDIRTIQTDVFATPFSLRFPRCQKIRYDKPWYDCLDIETYQDMVLASGGNVIDGARYTELEGTQVKTKRIKAEKTKLPLVPAHLMGTDVSDVKQSSTIFQDCVIYFANFPPNHSKDEMHRLVVEHGGSFSMNQIDAVTHMVADRKEGPYYQAAARFGDVIHTSWVFDCIAARELLHIRPKYYLHLSEATRQNLRSEMDDFGDSYYDDLDTADLVQLFANMDPSKVSISQDQLIHLEDKYDQGLHWGIFVGCHVSMHRPLHSSNVDSQAVAAIALQRLALEVRMYGGTATEQLGSVNTHLVVYAPTNYPITHDMVLKSLSTQERTLVQTHRMKIVGHGWIEACLDSQRPVKDTEYLIGPAHEEASPSQTQLSQRREKSPGQDSSDEEAEEPRPEVATPAKPSIYELNTRHPPPRSTSKQPPSVIKVRSKRDATGKKIIEESENQERQIVLVNEQKSEETLIPEKIDIYALNMRPPPRKKQAASKRTRGSRTVAAPRAKRKRAARPKVTSDDEEDEVIAEDEEEERQPQRKQRETRGQKENKREVKSEERDSAEDGMHIDARAQDPDADVNPKVEADVEPRAEARLEERFEDDVKPDVSRFEQKRGRQKRQEVKQEPGVSGLQDDVKPDVSRLPARKVQKGRVEVKQEIREEPFAEDEVKRRTGALFTRKRPPETQGVASTLNETGPSRYVRVKEEPVSQPITGLDSQAEDLIVEPKEPKVEQDMWMSRNEIKPAFVEPRVGVTASGSNSAAATERHGEVQAGYDFRESTPHQPITAGAKSREEVKTGSEKRDAPHLGTTANGEVEPGAPSAEESAKAEEGAAPKKKKKVNFRDMLAGYDF